MPSCCPLIFINVKHTSRDWWDSSDWNEIKMKLNASVSDQFLALYKGWIGTGTAAGDRYSCCLGLWGEIVMKLGPEQHWLLDPLLWVHLISPGCTRPNSAFIVLKSGLKHQHFISFSFPVHYHWTTAVLFSDWHTPTCTSYRCENGLVFFFHCGNSSSMTSHFSARTCHIRSIMA